MDPVDKLLAELKAQQSQLQPSVEPPVQPKADQPSGQPADTLDDLLGQIAAETQRSVRAELSKRPSSPPTAQQPFAGSADAARSPEMSLLAELQAQYSEHDRAAALRQQQAAQAVQRKQQQQEREKQNRLKQLKQQRRAALSKQAEVWLRKLNPSSEEGRWFDEFSCGYESRLEAAIDYLEALQDVNRGV